MDVASIRLLVLDDLTSDCVTITCLAGGSGGARERRNDLDIVVTGRNADLS